MNGYKYIAENFLLQLILSFIFMNNASEAEIKKAILDYLQYLENLKKVVAIRNNSFCGKLISPNGREGYIKNNKPGAPDIICCYHGRFIGLEVKSEKGKQTDEQKLFQEKLEKVGGQYFVVRSLDEVRKLIY